MDLFKFKPIAQTIQTLTPLTGKVKRKFLTEIFILFLSIKGRINFLQMERHGIFSERYYRLNFEKGHDLLALNLNMISCIEKGDFFLAFDPSFVPKSGKRTPGIGNYWSGCAGRALKGLEISGIAAVDSNANTAYHLDAAQTMVKGNETLCQWYLRVIEQRKEMLLQVSSIFVADAWFSKRSFTDGITEKGFILISRLRDDAVLMYPCHEGKTGRRGRPKLYGGRVDRKSISMEHFSKIYEDRDTKLYSAVLYSKSLKRKVKVVRAEYTNKKGETIYKLYFSTDTSMNGLDIIKYYRQRFQIEFLYRDGKQHTGLSTCQARSENKMNSHYNIALTSINIAKYLYWTKLPADKRGAFSMADIKTVCHNNLLLSAFLDEFGIEPDISENRDRINKLLTFGCMVA